MKHMAPNNSIVDAVVRSNDVNCIASSSLLQMKRSIDTMVKSIRPARRRNVAKPTGFPLHSVGDIRNFEGVDDEKYFAVVDYCVWLAGSNPNECTNLYIKTLLSNGVYEHITWSGANDTFALKGTRLANAFEEAMNRNKNLKKVDCAIMTESMRRALHCAKKRLRKSRMAANNQDPQSESDDDGDEF
ncbi:hypothetical protein PV327_005193 [Microctonus hyperodae]|uniref:Uncharacterized protein n=1 Tax=Microctonus hyperodae TaxID=165561 RepID=A0AA39KZK1_MICHY|nr:hypothetical protein PV327_005193 [Microctonus hyperodae]